MKELILGLTWKRAADYARVRLAALAGAGRAAWRPIRRISAFDLFDGARATPRRPRRPDQQGLPVVVRPIPLVAQEDHAMTDLSTQSLEEALR